MFYRYSFVTELRSQIRLSELISSRVRLYRRGREFVALCPFHSEKTPSFYVVEDKDFYHCFGCGAHGDVIDFIMQADRVSYAEAVEKLAEEAGLATPKATEARSACGDRQLAPTAVAAARPIWIPILPVPNDAPALLSLDGRTVALINPKQAGTPKVFAAWQGGDGRASRDPGHAQVANN